MAKKLGERLIESGLITAEALEKALAQQRITGHKLGDCLVEIGVLQEAQLLRFLAAEFKTRFVSTEKLAQVKIPPEVLDRIPVRMAEQQLVLPIAWDRERRALSVVMAEPQNEALVKEIALVTEMEEIHAFIALRSAILAGIRKHYYGDPTAFSQEATGSNARADVSALSRAWEGVGNTGIKSSPSLRAETDPSLRARLRGGTGQPTQMKDLFGAVRGTLGDNDYIETLSILVGMLEARREHFRGHSALLARQAGQVARRLGLPPRDVSFIAIAAYLHDLGKPTDKHLTLAANAAQPEWKAEAKRFFRAPIKLFETVHLPVQVNAILAQLHEAWDGSGVPQGARGDEIAPGARVLAAVDAYLDLTRNPKNGLGRALAKAEALAHLRSEAGRLYDPQVVEILERLQSGDLLRQRIENDGRVILVAESDASVRTALVDGLLRAGLVAHGVPALDGVAEAVTRGEADLLVVALRFGLPDLIALTQYVRSQPECAGVPIAVLGEADPPTRAQLQQHGVNTIVSLPLDAEAAAQTIMDLNEDRIVHGAPARLVQGTFDELSMHEVLRVLARNRKSGRLTVSRGGREASLQLESGRVVFAQMDGKTPEEALIELATRSSGDFAWDANAVLMEMPTLDQDLEVLVARLAPASGPAAAAG
ncbi:MAG: DUF4388 domain-containing protein [Myxococcaceae bacterium]|nr:DUF4388 domain-containing protein [Myxococcaceae bacterium]